MITTTLVTSLLSPTLILGEPVIATPVGSAAFDGASAAAETPSADPFDFPTPAFSSHKFGVATSTPPTAAGAIPSAPVLPEAPTIGTLATTDHGRLDHDLTASFEPDLEDRLPTLASADRDKAHWWSLHIAPGATLVLPLFGNYGQGIPAGPSLRFAGHVNRMFGKFFIGGGPVAHYSLFFAKDSTGDRASAHIFTIGGDLFLGGGNEKLVGYGHISMGAGILSLNASDGATGTLVAGVLPAGRIVVGGGMHGFVTEKVSVGFLTDFILPFGLDVFATVGIHFK